MSDTDADTVMSRPLIYTKRLECCGYFAWRSGWICDECKQPVHACKEGDAKKAHAPNCSGGIMGG